MADSFFGFDTSASNLNDDDGGGGDGSEDEYDALNDETFGQAGDFDWEQSHEQLAGQLESSRRYSSMDESQSQLEASLNQLVLDDGPVNSTFNTSSVWPNDPVYTPSKPKIPAALKNVCTVEELERQMRQKQQQQQHPMQNNQNFFQPRFPPVILQRPPGLQAPLPLPFAPQQQIQQNMNHINKMTQMNQNNPMVQNSQMAQNQYNQNQIFQNNSNQIINHMMVQNQNGPMMNQMVHNSNQMVQNGNQFNKPMNQFPMMNMNQQRMMPPPPGLGMPRQNFNPNMGQYNQNFRGPTKPMDQHQQMNQSHLIANQQKSQLKTQSPITQSHQKQSSPKNQMVNQNHLLQNQIMQNQNQKMQKHRVIYNSNQKNNMSSENLVQYIQNTHPILQMNNSFHNANHHPMLNRNNMFNGNQVLNHPMFNNQRVNGDFNNSHMTNGDHSSSESKENDEYSGLMSQREKQWLINIQMLQLNTGTPYIHDFYYTVFLERKSKKEKEGVKEAHKANQQNHPFYSGGVKPEPRERHNSQRHNSQSEDVQPRTYVLTQFENSLGKLQCCSVTAPRKIIDVEVVHSEPTNNPGSRANSVASTSNATEFPREVRRTKQILLDIEALYLILLRIEELNDPLAISNALILKEREEKQKLLEAAQKEAEAAEVEDTNLFLRNIESVQRKPKTETPKPDIVDKRQVVNLAVNQNPLPTTKNLLDENREELINKMFGGLLYEDKVQQFMMVRKGKALVARFLSRALPTHPLSRALWSRLLRALPAACRRDPALHDFVEPFHRYIQSSTGWQTILESTALIGEALDPARTPYALTSAFTLSCICSLIEKAMVLVNTPEAIPNERQWTKFLKTVARALKNTTLTVAKPLHPLQEQKLLQHLKQVPTTVEILQRGKTTPEFADLTKTDISEQLVRHLC